MMIILRLLCFSALLVGSNFAAPIRLSGYSTTWARYAIPWVTMNLGGTDGVNSVGIGYTEPYSRSGCGFGGCSHDYDYRSGYFEGTAYINDVSSPLFDFSFLNGKVGHLTLFADASKTELASIEIIGYSHLVYREIFPYETTPWGTPLRSGWEESFVIVPTPEPSYCVASALLLAVFAGARARLTHRVDTSLKSRLS